MKLLENYVNGGELFMGNKNSSNDNIGKILILILWIVLIFVFISSIILWKGTANWLFFASGIIGSLGVLFNIYILSKVKSNNKE